MPNIAFTALQTITDNASFRLTGSTISAALATVGMVQTADTGQINWVTVVRAGANSDAGYEIWRFNDSLQGTTPIFLRIGYGSGTNTSYFRATISCGSATDGAGNLSGAGSGFAIVFVNASGGDVARDCWISSDGSGLVIGLFLNSSNVPARGIAIIDRFRNTAGAAVGTGWIIVTLGGVKSTTTVNATDGTNLTISYFPCLIPFPISNSASSLDANNSVMVFPWYPACQRGVFASKMILSYPVVDLGYDSQQSVIHLGGIRNYRSLGSTFSYLDSSSSASATGMIWWGD